MKLQLIAVLMLTTLGITVNAQQAPMYTHYMYNTLSVNPAYAGSRDALTVTGLHRSQWVDFKGAPVTQTITMHSPLANDKIGLGLSILNDKIGATNNSAIFADFAYRLQLNEKSKLALGLSAGVNIFQANLQTLDLDEQSDPMFANNIRNHTTPNFGLGAYYSRERFYAGISTPALVNNVYVSTNQPNGTTLVSKEQRHYFLIAGAQFKISNFVEFKPTTLVKVTAAAPAQAELTATFILNKKIHLGVMARSGDAFGALIGFDVAELFHIGYSYDHSVGLKTGRYNAGSHELVMRYDFIYSSKKQIHSPRNF